MKITIKEKDGITLYKVGRKIVCFSYGLCFAIGTPSNTSAAIITCESEEEAKKSCIRICKRQLLSRKGNDPLKVYDID